MYLQDSKIGKTRTLGIDCSEQGVPFNLEQTTPIHRTSSGPTQNTMRKSRATPSGNTNKFAIKRALPVDINSLMKDNQPTLSSADPLSHGYGHNTSSLGVHPIFILAYSVKQSSIPIVNLPQFPNSNKSSLAWSEMHSSNNNILCRISVDPLPRSTDIFEWFYFFAMPQQFYTAPVILSNYVDFLVYLQPRPKLWLNTSQFHYFHLEITSAWHNHGFSPSSVQLQKHTFNFWRHCQGLWQV